MLDGGKPSTIFMVTTRLSRVILWVDGFSFSPCIQRVSGVLTSFRNLSPATRFSPFFPRSFSVWAGILCFLRTGSDTSPVADILSEQAFSLMTVFWGCVKTSNDLKNHPFSQTKSRSQVLGSDIYSDFLHPESIIISSFRLYREEAAVGFFTFDPLDWIFFEPKKFPEAFGKFLLLFFEFV